MKKLYVIDVNHTVYALAESEKEAEREGVRGIHDCGDEPIVSAREVTRGPIDPGWQGAIPYGSDENQTVSQILRLNTQKS